MLLAVGVVDESPWDGVTSLTAEVGPSGSGVARLVAAMLLLMALCVGPITY